MARYETKGVQPPADTLSKMADLFGTSVDFLIYGNAHSKASAAITDDELLLQFKEVEKFNEDDKNTVKKLIDAFITKKHVQQLAR